MRYNLDSISTIKYLFVISYTTVKKLAFFMSDFAIVISQTKMEHSVIKRRLVYVTLTKTKRSLETFIKTTGFL